MRCQAHTKDGRPCGAPAQHNSGYCYMHDPAKVEARDAARKKGGAARRDQLRGGVVPNLQQAADVRQYLCRVLHDTERLLIPAATAKAIAILCKTQLETIQAADLHSEIEMQRREAEERRRY